MKRRHRTPTDRNVRMQIAARLRKATARSLQLRDEIAHLSTQVGDLLRSLRAEANP